MKVFVSVVLVVFMGIGVYSAFEKSNSFGFAAMTMCLLSAIHDTTNRLDKSDKD